MSSFSLNDLARPFGNTPEPCCAVDGQQRIILWNEGATLLLGHSADQVLGQPCYRILPCTDEQGRQICRSRCLAWRRARQGHLTPNCRLFAQTADGQSRAIEMSTVVFALTETEGPYLVHYLRDRISSDGPSEPSRPTPPASREAPKGSAALSPREREVLALLTHGASTAQIAEELCISRVTARNHIQRVVEKLGAHSRLEAVAVATYRQLLPLERDGDREPPAGR